MIRHIRFAPEYAAGTEALECNYNVSVQDGFLLFNVFGRYYQARLHEEQMNFKKLLDFEIEANLGKVIEVFLTSTNIAYSRVVYTYKTARIIDRASDIDSSSVQKARRLATICIEMNGDITILTYPATPKIQMADEDIVINDLAFNPNGNATFYYLGEVSPAYRGLRDKQARKQVLVQEYDKYDTLAYLEAQVDTLTRLVLQMADELKIAQNTPESSVTDMCIATLKEADAYSVFSVSKDLKQEFQHKKEFRARQKEYFKSKEAGVFKHEQKKRGRNYDSRVTQP